MESLSFDHLNNLEKARSDWKIKVRVTRMWATVSPDSGTVKGYNLILLDDDNAHVHAFAYADVWKSIGKDVVEGHVYVVDTFSVRDAAGNLKPVSSKMCIRFTHATTFVPSIDDSMIPDHKFEFLDLGDLYNQASRYASNENPEYATDVIGVVEEFEQIRKIGTRYVDRDIVRFKLCDGSFRHRVSVWGELAKSVNDDYFMELEKPIIVILTSTKLTTYQSSVQIGTLPSSKVYFNLKDDYVLEMRQRLDEEGYKSSPNDDQRDYDLIVVPSYEKFSLKELNENIADKVKKQIVCTFVIAKVDNERFWWYNSCNNCQSEVIKSGRSYKCDDCPRCIPVTEKRFNVKVSAEDSTFACDVHLMDRVVKRMISTIASKLKKDTDKDPKMVPTIITDMVRKEVSVIIDVIKDSASEDVFCFKAVDIYDMLKANTSIAESSTPPEVSSIALTDSLDQIDGSKTPGSAISVNKKIKMEK